MFGGPNGALTAAVEIAGSRCLTEEAFGINGRAMIIDLVRGPRRSRRRGRKVNFERVLKEVLWCLVTEGGISYRRIKLSFALDDDGLEDGLMDSMIGSRRWRLTSCIFGSA
jgi:hypothetical protein